MPEKPPGEKIQKVLAASGICSRRGAEELVRRGLVRVNGEVVTNPAIRVDPAADRIEVRGEKLTLPADLKPAGLLLYKTAGYVTSQRDPHNRNTVYDLLPPGQRNRKWLYAGRLDKDTEGLLLFTDSGALVQRLTHPSFKVEKQYEVRVKGHLNPARLKRLEQGLRIEGRVLRMERARILYIEPESTVLDVVLHQGEKRQIKRMLQLLGYEVSYLRRVRLGRLTLEGLEKGECRRLTDIEMEELLRGAETGR